VGEFCQQDSVPLLEALLRHASSRRERFHVPGHKGGLGAYSDWVRVFGRGVLDLDLTELPGLDDPHWPAPEGIVEQAQVLAAEAFGARDARFLVGGATAGVLAMVLGAVRPRKLLLAAQPFHRSVAAAATLAGCELNSLPVRLAGSAGIPLPAPADALRREIALRRPAAVLVTSPTYHGVTADLRGYADVCREGKIPLLVDAAHGAHFGFAPELPPEATRFGVSACVISLHKTAGALTPGAVLLIGPRDQEKRPAHGQESTAWIPGHERAARTPGQDAPATIDLARVDAALRLVETSSPSFPVLASLDLARRRLAVHGAEDWGKAVKLASQTASRIALEGFGWLGPFKAPHGQDQDPTRLTLELADETPPDLTGLELAQAAAAGAVDLEMAGWGHVVAVTGPADTPESHDCLVSVLTRALEVKTYSGPKRELALAMEKDCWEAERVIVLTPAEAFRRRSRLVMVDEAAGRVAKDIISPFPPGVPLVFPGQRITEADALYLTFLGQWGARAYGLTERTAQVEVIA